MNLFLSYTLMSFWRVESAILPDEFSILEISPSGDLVRVPFIAAWFSSLFFGFFFRPNIAVFPELALQLLSKYTFNYVKFFSNWQEFEILMIIIRYLNNYLGFGQISLTPALQVYIMAPNLLCMT